MIGQNILVMMPFRHEKHSFGKQLVQSSRAILALGKQSKLTCCTMSSTSFIQHLGAAITSQQKYTNCLTQTSVSSFANTQLHSMFKDTFNCVVLQLATVQLFTVNATKQMTYALLRPSPRFPLTSVLPLYGAKKVTST